VPGQLLQAGHAVDSRIADHDDGTSAQTAGEARLDIGLDARGVAALPQAFGKRRLVETDRAGKRHELLLAEGSLVIERLSR
jgi:hypothetical protein